MSYVNCLSLPLHSATNGGNGDDLACEIEGTMNQLTKEEMKLVRKALKTYQTFYKSPSNDDYKVVNQLLDKLLIPAGVPNY